MPKEAPTKQQILRALADVVRRAEMVLKTIERQYPRKSIDPLFIAIVIMLTSFVKGMYTLARYNPELKFAPPSLWPGEPGCNEAD